MQKNRETIKGTIARIVTLVAFGVIALVITWPLLSVIELSTHYIAMITVISVVSIAVIRAYVITTDWLGSRTRNILFVGTGKKASYVEKRMRRDKDLQELVIPGFIPVHGDRGGIKNENIIQTPQNGLVIYALKNEIDEIVIACDEARNNLQVDELVACKIKGIDVIDMCDFVEREVCQIPTNFLTPYKLAISGGFHSHNHGRNAFDWFFNVTLAYILFMVAWPFMLLTALFIKLEGGWKAPVLYRQERVGVKGKIFSIYKFRSMRIDAKKYGAKMTDNNDNRITKIGNVIRKVRIDELPQIFNIMCGDMGIVGPRPEFPVFVDDLVKKYSYFGGRHNVKPGLTGGLS